MKIQSFAQNTVPEMSLYRLLTRVYPYDLVVDQDQGQLKAVNDTLQTFGFSVSEPPSPTSASLLGQYAASSGGVVKFLRGFCYTLAILIVYFRFLFRILSLHSYPIS